MEGLPNEVHLYKCRLERMDLLEELRRARTGEEERHRFQMVTGEQPEGPLRSPLGAPMPGKRRPPGGPGPSRGTAAATTALTPEESQAARRLSRLGLEISQDPTKLPNEHEARCDALQQAIAEQQRKLAASRSEGALRAAVDFAEPPINWDRLPTANSLGASESQLQYFARSLDKVRECGNFKDPKHCRPFDYAYVHREALCRQKHVMLDK